MQRMKTLLLTARNLPFIIRPSPMTMPYMIIPKYLYIQQRDKETNKTSTIINKAYKRKANMETYN